MNTALNHLPLLSLIAVVCFGASQCTAQQATEASQQQFQTAVSTAVGENAAGPSGRIVDLYGTNASDGMAVTTEAFALPPQPPYEQVPSGEIHVPASSDELCNDPRCECSGDIVRNWAFFGVDRNQCCDEWSGFCKMKSLKYRCGCGGLKTNRGHLGMRWLRLRRGGETCDYCNGGCCDQCNSRGGKRSATPAAVFNRPVDSCDRCDQQACGDDDEAYCESCR